MQGLQTDYCITLFFGRRDICSAKKVVIAE
jgi:hypothetical protein